MERMQQSGHGLHRRVCRKSTWAKGGRQVDSSGSNTSQESSTSLCCPIMQVVEPPDVWDYSMLFSQLKAELQNEMDHTADGSTSGATQPGGEAVVCEAPGGGGARPWSTQCCPPKAWLAVISRDVGWP